MHEQLELQPPSQLHNLSSLQLISLHIVQQAPGPRLAFKAQHHRLRSTRPGLPAMHGSPPKHGQVRRCRSHCCTLHMFHWLAHEGSWSPDAYTR